MNLTRKMTLMAAGLSVLTIAVAACDGQSSVTTEITEQEREARRLEKLNKFYRLEGTDCSVKGSQYADQTTKADAISRFDNCLGKHFEAGKKSPSPGQINEFLNEFSFVIWQTTQADKKNIADVEDEVRSDLGGVIRDHLSQRRTK